MRCSPIAAIAALPLAFGCARGGDAAEPEPQPVANVAPEPEDPEPPDAPTGAEAVTRLESIAAQMCACEDTACADAAMHELTGEAEALAESGATGTHEEWNRTGRASEQATTCFLDLGGSRDDVIAMASLSERLPLRLSKAITLFAAVQGGDDEAVELERFAETICACADKACVETEFDPFIDYVEQLEAANAKGSEMNIDRAGKAAERAVNCYQKHGGDPQKLLELANSVQ